MAEQRHVFRVGKSLVVAVPARVREHMGVERGQAVYWHLVRGKEAVLTRRDRRAGGHPEGLALQRQLTAALAEVERLRRQLAARPQRLLNQGRAHGWTDAMRAEGSLDRRLAVIDARLDEITARLPFRPRRVRARAAQVVSIDHYPSPEPSSSSVPSGGDAASGGAAPQAAHDEATPA
jgi:antitoxin component of MazEF toxin-antitoxin module